MTKFPINDFYKTYWQTQLQYNRSELLNDLPWEDFIKIVSTMNIRSGGVSVEDRILKKNNWDKIKGHANHGDGRTPAGEIVEIKLSIISPLPSSTISFKGIRPWHNIDYHIIIIVDMKNFESDPITKVFKLSKSQLMEEVRLKSLSPYSGKKADRIGQSNVQLGASFKTGDLERWELNYLTQINL